MSKLFAVAGVTVLGVRLDNKFAGVANGGYCNGDR
jgi:hypothetical protein